ncbi:MAG: hypothetical protein ACRDPO_02160 [Streptosporangiaceae bacterium]
MPGDITADQLDPEAAAELRTLPGDLADAVARYLVAAGREEDPERAYDYARAARGLAARVGIVRETAAIAAYQAGKWQDALAELRAARRLTGRSSYLPLMADSERALGRMDRALDIATGPEARAADRAAQLELLIVESGIRRDQGLPEAAVVALQVPELNERRGRAGNPRLLYAYADALLEAGRDEEARDWFGRAAAADPAGETDAAERVDELDDVLFEDLDDEDDASEADDVLDEADEDESDEDDEDTEDDDLEDADDLEDLDESDESDEDHADEDDDLDDADDPEDLDESDGPDEDEPDEDDPEGDDGDLAAADDLDDSEEPDEDDADADDDDDDDEDDLEDLGHPEEPDEPDGDDGGPSQDGKDKPAGP